MRIGFDAKRFYHNNTGLGNYSRSLIKILSENFVDNRYVLFNPKKTNRFSLLTYNNSVEEVLPKGFLAKKFNSFWRLIWVKKAIDGKKIDVFHGLSGEIPLFLPKQLKKIVTIHDLIFVRYPELYSYFDCKIHFLKFKNAAEKADIVVAISEQTKNDIVSFLGVSPEKIKVIYQGCSDLYKVSYAEKEKEEIVNKFELPEKFILNVGTIETRKNALLIIKAIQGTNIHLVLVGRKTAYYNEIENFIINNKMQKQVFYISSISQNELAVLYQCATLFVYPSIFEGFGIPIIEALYSKIPVIASDIAVFLEAGGSNSTYVGINDVAGLQKVIIKLYNNQLLCNEIAEKGFDFAQKFNDNVVATQWQKLYQSLL
jgi:glycosyltransferase involved in cell wall biosynthesis